MARGNRHSDTERDTGGYVGEHRTDRAQGTLANGEPLIGKQAGYEGRDATLLTPAVKPAED